MDQTADECLPDGLGSSFARRNRCTRAISPTSIAQGRESEWNIRLPARNVVVRKPPPPTTFSQRTP